MLENENDEELKSIKIDRAHFDLKACQAEICSSMSFSLDPYKILDLCESSYSNQKLWIRISIGRPAMNYSIPCYGL